MNQLIRRPLLLAFWFHLPFVVGGIFLFSFDAAVHIFFADHYAQSWWSLWEPRWYTGFSVASYPPLVHQILAILGTVMPLKAAFGITLFGALLAMPVAVYTYARVYLEARAAAWAALAAVVLPSIALAGHTFGQLPTLIAAVLMLLGAGRLGRYLESGATRDLAVTVALAGAVAAAHHATFMFALPVFFGAVVGASWLQRSFLWRNILVRTAIAAGASIVAGGVTIAPFWMWAANFRDQSPIDHLSRHNLLTDLDAQALFFWASYGVLFATALGAGFMVRRRPYLSAVVATVFLFTLSLGGTTQLPSWIFGARWEWLTYDRFALWAGLAALPPVGATLATLAAGSPSSRVRVRELLNLKRVALVSFVVAQFIFAASAAMLPLLGRLQPQPIDLNPIVEFLDEPDHRNWRYLTLGLGDQMIFVTARTEAQSVDGGYHTARTIRELVESGIGHIDYALWWNPDGQSLDRFLAASGKYSLRWVFSNERRYEPYLARHGWERISLLENGVWVWDRADVPEIASVDPPVPDGGSTDAISGVLPLSMLSVALALIGLPRRPRIRTPIGLSKRPAPASR